MQKFCLAIETQIEAIFNDAFAANSLGGQWPMSMCAAPPKDTTTTNSGNDKSTVCLTEMMDGSTARASFQRRSSISRSQTIMHVYGDRKKKASGDSFDEVGMLPSSQRIMHMYNGRPENPKRDAVQKFNEAGVAGDKFIYSLRNGDTEDFFSDISKDEERRMRRRRKDKDDKVQQLRRSGGEPSRATAGKKKGLSGNKKSSRGKKEVVKLAVSHGSDAMSLLSEESTSAEAMLAEAIMAQQRKNLKKRSAAGRRGRT